MSTSMALIGVQCLHTKQCEFFDDVLLVIKLNPTRILWVDFLINLYATAFRHVVFFSALKRGDPTSGAFLRVGSRDTVVHLIDDNYGFCDHETVAQASEWWPDFSGYVFLSDDVLFEFWKVTDLRKDVVWRQKASLRSKEHMTASERAAVDELARTMPDLRLPHSMHYPFAATSGIYFVPRALMATFRRVSHVMMKHRTYNEWGTPIVLASTEVGPSVLLRGRLVWGKKRFAAFRTMSQDHHIWYHPVRATSETFARVLHWVHSARRLEPTSVATAAALFHDCFVCASHPSAVVVKKGLYHSCLRAQDDAVCGPRDALFDSFTKRVVSLQKLASVPQAALVGGRTVVPPTWLGVPNPFELDHEGFWGAEVTDYVFQQFYPLLNRSTTTGKLLLPMPTCCVYNP